MITEVPEGLTSEEVDFLGGITDKDWTQLEDNLYVAKLKSKLQPELVDTDFQDVFELQDIVIEHPRLGSTIGKYWIPAQDCVILWRNEGTRPVKYLAKIWHGVHNMTYQVLNGAEVMPNYQAYIVNLSTGMERGYSFSICRNSRSAHAITLKLIQSLVESRVDGEHLIQGLKAYDVDGHIPLKGIKVVRNYLGGYFISDEQNNVTASAFVEYVNRCLDPTLR